MKKNISSNKEIEIKSDVLPLKSTLKFKIESIDLSYRPEENEKKKLINSNINLFFFLNIKQKN